MEDVLGGLCTAIANSIRGGLGDIGKMAPTAFPDKIDEIVNMLKNAGGGGGSSGGSGGGGSTGNLKFATGVFKADANRSRATVTHGMDTMPDFILVQLVGWYLGEFNEYLEELPLEAAWGFKSTFAFDYLSAIVVPAASFPNTTFGIDNVPASSRSVGYIYCPDEKTFEVGAVDANSGMLTNKDGISYRWIALSGLGASNSADLRYVTFKDDTGTVEYGKKATATGDDCADPIARGIFSTPTKASTAQYDYPFSGGWATTPGGGINSNALKAVNEDRTVYANFAAVLRVYNARFYDGDTLYATVPTTYGMQAVPPTLPGKEGYYLKGWIPSDLTVYGDTDFVADWAEAKGYAYVTTFGDFPNEYIIDLAFNKDCTHVAVGMSGQNNAPFVYDISGDTPVLINHGNSEINALQNVDYSYDGSYLYGALTSYASTKYTGAQYKYKVTNGNYDSGTFITGSGSGTKSCTVCRCSPVSDNVALGITGSSNTQIKLNGKIVTIGGPDPSRGEYSPDGALFAVSGTSASAPFSYFTNIYNTSDGSLVRQIVHSSSKDGKMESFNKDGSLIAIRNKKAPYVNVYSVSTGEKVYSFDDLTVETGACCFVRGTNELIVSEGTTIRAFDFTNPTDPVEIENVPDRQRTGTPYFMRSSADGRMVGIMSRESMDIEVWRKL